MTPPGSFVQLPVSDAESPNRNQSIASPTIMYPQAIQDVRVGVVAFIAILAIVLGIVWGKGCGLGVESQQISISVPNAAGVDAGTAVVVRGVRVGSVLAVRPTRDDVRLTAIVSTTVALFDDASASIRMLELTGGKVVEVVPGNSGRPLGRDETILGTVDDLGVLVGHFSRFSLDASRLLLRLDSLVSGVNEMMIQRGVRDDIVASIADVAAITRAMRTLVHESGSGARMTIGNAHAISQELRSLVRSAAPTTERLLATMDTLGHGAQQTTENLNRTLRSADTLIRHLDRLLMDVSKGNGTVSRLLHDKSMADDLHATMNALKALIEEINQNGVRANVKVDLF